MDRPRNHMNKHRSAYTICSRQPAQTPAWLETFRCRPSGGRATFQRRRPHSSSQLPAAADTPTCLAAGAVRGQPAAPAVGCTGHYCRWTGFVHLHLRDDHPAAHRDAPPGRWRRLSCRPCCPCWNEHSPRRIPAAAAWTRTSRCPRQSRPLLRLRCRGLRRQRLTRCLRLRRITCRQAGAAPSRAARNLTTASSLPVAGDVAAA
eukprot:364902-Chlamydomonas_euryale.AAC.14